MKKWSAAGWFVIGVGVAHDRPYALAQSTSDQHDALLVHALDREETVAELPGAGPHQSVEIAIMSPDGTKVAAAIHGRVLVWSLADHELIQRFDRDAVQLAFSNDAKLLAMAGTRGVCIGDLSTGDMSDLPALDDQIATAVGFSSNGELVAAGYDRGTLRLWNRHTRRETKFDNQHTHVVRSVAFEPNGTRIITAANDGTVRAWDSASGKEIETIQDNLPSGRRDRTDGTVGTEVVRKMPEFAVTFAGFTQDGRKVVTASMDGRVRAHFVNLEDLTPYARCMLPLGSPARADAICDGSEKLFPSK